MRQGDTPAAVNAWTRSAYAGNNDNFCLVNTDGTPNNNNADNSRALAPDFIEWVESGRQERPEPV